MRVLTADLTACVPLPEQYTLKRVRPSVCLLRSARSSEHSAATLAEYRRLPRACSVLHLTPRADNGAGRPILPRTIAHLYCPGPKAAEPGSTTMWSAARKSTALHAPLDCLAPRAEVRRDNDEWPVWGRKKPFRFAHQNLKCRRFKQSERVFESLSRQSLPRYQITISTLFK